MSEPPSAQRFSWLGPCLLTAAAFAAAYGQAPLFYSNQNQYFLHGLAHTDDGPLAEDWLAGTIDPTPLFSGLVAGISQVHPWLFYVLHAAILGLYAASLFWVFVYLAGNETAQARWPIFAVVLVALHSAAARWVCYRLLGQDYAWYFQSGLAGQYLLGGMLQPSVFGVLLAAAVALFLHDWVFAAGLCVAAAATMHQTYLLAGAFLTLGFMAALWRQGRLPAALVLGGWTFLLVLPITLHGWLTFRPTSETLFADAQAILVEIRIPHHCRVDLWLDEVAMAQIAWIILGTGLAWGTSLFSILGVAAALAASLTFVQAATYDDTLALLFPWRISAVLVPLATTIIVARLVALAPPAGTLARRIALASLAFLAVAGLGISAGRLAFRTPDDDELDLYAKVREQRAAGQVFLLPVRIPNLASTTRGSASSDFKPLPEKRTDDKLIPLDLQRFRLHAGTPIFVDFKSIPYKDTEVLDWFDRLLLAEAAQKKIEAGKIAEVLPDLRKRGITHIVQPARAKVSGEGIKLAFSGGAYAVYGIEP